MSEDSSTYHSPKTPIFSGLEMYDAGLQMDGADVRVSVSARNVSVFACIG